MVDREKVIKGLECCEKANNCGNCPYDGECTKRDFALTRDAIALLKEQEPVLPLWQENKPHCGQCGEWLFGKMNFCTRCGRKVKWDV